MEDNSTWNASSTESSLEDTKHGMEPWNASSTESSLEDTKHGMEPWNASSTESSLEDTMHGMEPRSIITAIIFQLLVGIVAILGNAIVIFICTRKRNRNEKTMKFILHLAITDCGTGITNLIQIPYFFVETLNGIMITCFLRYQLVTFFTLVSQALVAMTTCERFVAICWRSHYTTYMTSQNIKIMIFSSWFFGFVVAALPIFDLDFVPFQTPCFYHLILPSWALIVNAVVSYLTIFISVSLFYRIITKARSFYRRIKLHRRRTECETSLRNRQMRKSIRNGKVMGIVTVVFILCWVPFNVFEIRYGLGYTDDNPDMVGLFIFLAMTSSVVNIFIYAWQKDEFKEEFKRVFGREQPVETVEISTISSPGDQSKKFYASSERLDDVIAEFNESSDELIDRIVKENDGNKEEQNVDAQELKVTSADLNERTDDACATTEEHYAMKGERCKPKMLEDMIDVNALEEEAYGVKQSTKTEEERLGEKEKTNVAGKQFVCLEEQSIRMGKSVFVEEQNIDGMEKGIKIKIEKQSIKVHVEEQGIDIKNENINKKEKCSFKMVQNSNAEESNYEEEQGIDESEQTIEGKMQDTDENENNYIEEEGSDEKEQRTEGKEQKIKEEEQIKAKKEQRTEGKDQKIKGEEQIKDKKEQKIKQEELIIDDHGQNIKVEERIIDEKERNINVEEHNFNEREQNINLEQNFDIGDQIKNEEGQTALEKQSIVREELGTDTERPFVSTNNQGVHFEEPRAFAENQAVREEDKNVSLEVKIKEIDKEIKIDSQKPDISEGKRMVNMEECNVVLDEQNIDGEKQRFDVDKQQTGAEEKDMNIK